MRLADRRPEQAGVLRLPPGHVGIGPGADEALDDVQHVRTGFIAGGRARHVAGLQIGIRGRRLQVGLGVVFGQERDQVVQVARPDAVGDVPAAILGVADGRAVIGRFRRVAAGQAPERHAAHDPVHDVELRVLGDRLVHRDRHVLALAVAMAGDQGGDDAGGELLAGDVVGVPDLRRDRRRVVFPARRRIVAAVHHHPAEREMDQVRPLEIRPRPIVAKRGDAGGDQFRETGVERRAIEAEHLVERAATGIEQDVRAVQQAQQLIAGRGLVQVQHDGLLVAVVVPEEQRPLQARLVVQEGADAAGGVALGRLDLDHFRAEAGQQQAGIFRALVGDLDHPQTGQHAGAGIAQHRAEARRAAGTTVFRRVVHCRFPSGVVRGLSWRAASAPGFSAECR